MNLEIKKILKTSIRFRYFKTLQKFLVLKFPKIMVVLVMMLSLQTNTIVSFVYITSMCALIFQNDMFYD